MPTLLLYTPPSIALIYNCNGRLGYKHQSAYLPPLSPHFFHPTGPGQEQVHFLLPWAWQNIVKNRDFLTSADVVHRASGICF